MESPPPMFVDVESLLESSRPRPRLPWVSYGFGAFVLMMLASTYFGDRSPQGQKTVQALSSLLMITLVSGMSLTTWHALRRQKAEQARLEAAEELVQLRRWTQAALLLQGMLARPARSQQARLQALVYFTSVLARFHRFADVIAIDDHLLETVSLDDGSTHAVKLARAMALLHEDRLFDADRAIADLRRSPQAAESGGLALLEIYRDVKTGHPEEALELFAARHDLIRSQLGHRVADAYMLVAKANDFMGRTAEAKAAYETATLLSPVVELNRRYPEVVSLAQKYAPTPAPAEVVG